MLTNKNDTMIDEAKLDRDEAKAFIACMFSELKRHIKERDEAKDIAKDFFLSNDRQLAVVKQFYAYGSRRHQDDINMIVKSIKYLRKKYDL